MVDRGRYADTDGHLDEPLVVARMLEVCQRLREEVHKIEDWEDDNDLPYVQIGSIADMLVEIAKDDGECVRHVLEVAEEVLAGYGQPGVDFIGAGLVEGIPHGGESLLAPFAGPLLLQQMAPWFEPRDEIRRVKLLWIDNWWDGPISGVALSMGIEHRFEAVWDPRYDDWLEPRTFWLFEQMTNDERDDAWNRHRLFEERVSTRWCFHEGVEASILRSAANWGNFYDRYPPRRAGNPPYPRAVGWFRLEAMGDFNPKGATEQP